MDARCNSRQAADSLGLSIRKVQEMAANGRLPGAAFYAGRWTFNRAKLAQFVADEESKVAAKPDWQPRSPALHFRAGTLKGRADGPLTQMIRQSRKRATKRAANDEAKG